MCARALAVLAMALLLRNITCCNFYPAGEYLKFVRIPEDLSVGDEVLQVEVHPRKNLVLQPVDRAEDAQLFTYRDLNRTHVAVVLAQSVDDLVDNDAPQNVVKFRLGCDFDSGDDLISAYLSVTVYIEDINDNAPRFLDTPYLVTVDELTPTGLTIFRGVRAFDRDKPNTPNSDIQYSISSGNDGGRFSLESSHKAGLILSKPLDYDSGDKEFFLTITASDRGSPPRSTNTTVHVMVQDNDDLPPRFTRDLYKTKIPEFYPMLGKKIHHELIFDQPIRAFDQDAGVAAPVRYELISGNERKMFLLSALNGSLFLEKEIDLDAESSLPGNSYVLQVQASQVDNPLKTALARVEVEVLDLNDNLPEFEVDFYNISIVENLPNGFSVLQVMASDRDQGDNGEFTYQLNDSNGAFSIDPRTGWLTVRNQSELDREQHTSLRMKVYAKEKNPSIVGKFIDKQRLSKLRRNPISNHLRDKTTYIFPDKLGPNKENIEYFEDLNQLMSYVTVEVTLLDANDNNPVFVPSNLYEFVVKSNANIGTEIGMVKAVDPDLGRNGMVLYDLQRTSNLTITSPFQVDVKTGMITLVETPLLEGRHALFIEASDQPANPSERRYSLAVVTIDVVGAKGFRADRPDFIGAPYEFWVGSNVGIGTSVGQIRVNEAMEKLDVTYDLLHGYEEGVPFAVEERSGVITVIDTLSKFERPLFDFEAVAIQPKLNVTITTNATVHVVNVNDERGVFLKGNHSPLVFYVKENIAGATIGKIFNVNMSNLPTNSTRNIRFTIANQQDVEEDIAIGQDGTIYTQKPLDRERRSTYQLTVIAEFNKGLISGAGLYQITIHVDDDNDNPPIFEFPSYEGIINENAPQGTEVIMATRMKAKDADIDQNSEFSVTIFGDGHELFSVNEESGIVTFIGDKLDREEKSLYLLKIVARDKGNLSSETMLTITVLDENDNEPKFNEITIPFGENIEFLEIDEKSKLNIYKESSSNLSSLIKVKAKPKNKYSVTAQSPLFLIPENVAIGTIVLKVNAIDLDIGLNSQVRYEFISEIFIPPFAAPADILHIKRYFVINEKHGHIVVARSLPPESEFRLNISAIDGGGLSDHIVLRFFIKDVNDHFPMFKKSWYTFNIEEAQYNRRILGKIDANDADFGQNANLTYYIQPSSKDLPFEISPLSGVFSVNGVLDREKEDKYTITVVAKDNGQDKKLSSSVSVEIQVLDVNDNAPKFFAFDEILEWKHPEAQELSNHNFESVMMIPIYKATLQENAPIGTTVTRVYANDTDFIGNGNGLILYSLPQRKNQLNLFSIDSKEGILTTTGRLDYETQKLHNVTVVASDLGSPSLSSTAIVMLTVKDVPDEIEVSNKPVFISRYYELEIEENVHTPVELLTLNLTEYYDNYKMKYFIFNENDTDIKKTFVIDPRNGTLYLIRSPDREIKDVYEIVVRAEKQKISRELPHMIYPVSDDVLEGMTKYDVKIIVRIKDVNDNAPKFINGGRPMVTAIPTTAPFGYEVIQLQATDADVGINADIRYQVINTEGSRFTVDAVSGRVRASGSFARDAGRVIGFDVKATDRRGADDGRSAIANVFVYVLDENKQLVLVVGAKPTEVEKQLDNITRHLSNITGFDVRVRRIETSSKSTMDGYATDMYIYAVDHISNAIINMDMLQKSLTKRELSLRQDFVGFKVLEVGDTTMVQARSGQTLSTVEMSIVALGCLVFVGACTTAICILCVRKNRSNQCQELNQSYSEADSYIDVINTSTMKQTCPHGNTVEEFGKAHQKCIKSQFADVNGTEKHERMCIKFNQRPLQKRRGQDTSITSVNSSGQDSGIAEAARCACGQSSAHTSEESSGCSYEDSLKSKKPKRVDQDQPFIRRASFNHQPFENRRYSHRGQSFSENLQRHFPSFERTESDSRLKKHISSPNVNVSQSYFVNGKKNYRRKETLNEPTIDYDHSEVEDVFDTRLDRRLSVKNKRGSFIELAGQPAVFVTTPAAAEMMRRNSERFLFARPL